MRRLQRHQRTVEVLSPGEPNDEIVWPGSAHGDVVPINAVVVAQVLQHHGRGDERARPEHQREQCHGQSILRRLDGRRARHNDKLEQGVPDPRTRGGRWSLGAAEEGTRVPAVMASRLRGASAAMLGLRHRGPGCDESSAGALRNTVGRGGCVDGRLR
jgi:hypothetical protein